MSNHNLKPIQIPLPLDGLTVEIPLTKGYVAIVDAIDADLLEFKWFAQTSKNPNKVYAARQKRVRKYKQKTTLMHVVIAERIAGRELLDGEQVDHWDLNKMNNTRSNLRITNFSGNATNKPLYKNNTSGFKGIDYRAKEKKWVARIGVNGVNVYLGFFKTAEDAYSAYCEAAKKYHGEFARLE